MLIVTFVYVCPTSTLTVTNICEGPTQITVSADNVQVCPNCYMATTWGYATAYAVPQSSLPVVWNLTQVPCSWGSYSSPTPTPTP